jgi:hypothetical protein
MNKIKIILLTFAFLFLFQNTAFARYSFTTYATDGITPLFVFDIANAPGEAYPSGNNPSNSWFSLTQGHYRSIQRAADFWAIILGNVPTNQETVRVAIGMYNDLNDRIMGSYGLHGTGMTVLSEAIVNDTTSDHYGNNPYYNTGPAFGEIIIGRASFPHSDYFGDVHIVTDNGMNAPQCLRF